MTGPLIPLSVVNSTKPYHLPPLIERWLTGDQYGKLGSSTNAGVIYVSLGNMAYLDAAQTNVLIQGLSVLADDPHFRVLWMMPPDQRPTLTPTVPSNFRVKVLGGVPHLKVSVPPTSYPSSHIFPTQPLTQARAHAPMHPRAQLVR